MRLLGQLEPRGRVRRHLRALRAGWSAAPGPGRELPDRYFIKAGYRAREAPAYDHEHGRADEIVWQPDVYTEAARIAQRLGCGRIADVGCGNGEKLAALYPRFEIVGIDLGPNLEFCRERYPHGHWIEHDLEREGSLPLPSGDPVATVLVCADVVEHLVRPENLLSALRQALGGVECLLVSTPERDLTWGVGHLGPPPNPAHVREWALGEFVALLVAEGFQHGVVGLTRSSSRSQQENTILARLFPDERRRAAAIGSSREG